MPSFTTRSASIGDIPAIVAIQEKTWEPTYREILSKEQIDFMFQELYSYDSLKKQMQAGQKFLLLESDGEEQGFSSVSEETPGVFKLHKIYVLPSSQGTGAGKFLLQATEQYVQELGATKLKLNVNRYNKAKTFYEKLGFEVIEEVDIPIGPYWMNDYVLSKTFS